MTPAQHVREAERLLDVAKHNAAQIAQLVSAGFLSIERAAQSSAMFVDAQASLAAAHAQIAQVGAIMLAERGAHTSEANDLVDAISGDKR